MDLNARFELGLNPADKSQKMATIELMNGELTAERLMVLPGNQNLTNQMRILSKDKTGKKEDPTLPNDMCIAEGTKITTSIGDVNIEDVDGYWKITALDLLEEKRLDAGANPGSADGSA